MPTPATGRYLADDIPWLRDDDIDTMATTDRRCPATISSVRDGTHLHNIEDDNGDRHYIGFSGPNKNGGNVGKSKYVKNTITLCSSVMLAMGPLYAQRNLLTSLHANIGRLTLGLFYLSILIGFTCFSHLYPRVKPKTSLVASMVGLLPFAVATPLLQSAIFLLPVAILAGISTSFLLHSYLVQLFSSNAAQFVSMATERSYRHDVFAVVMVILAGTVHEASQLLGNLITSLFYQFRDNG